MQGRGVKRDGQLSSFFGAALFDVRKQVDGRRHMDSGSAAMGRDVALQTGVANRGGKVCLGK